MKSSELKVGQKYTNSYAKYIGVSLWRGGGVGVMNVCDDGTLAACCNVSSDLDNGFLNGFQEADDNWQPKLVTYTSEQLRLNAPVGVYKLSRRTQIINREVRVAPVVIAGQRMVLWSSDSGRVYDTILFLNETWAKTNETLVTASIKIIK